MPDPDKIIMYKKGVLLVYRETHLSKDIAFRMLILK